MIFRFGQKIGRYIVIDRKYLISCHLPCGIGNIFPSNFTWKSWNGNDEKFVVIIYGFSGIYYIVEGFFSLLLLLLCIERSIVHTAEKIQMKGKQYNDDMVCRHGT